jgi:hypothetical protein
VAILFIPDYTSKMKRCARCRRSTVTRVLSDFRPHFEQRSSADYGDTIYGDSLLNAPNDRMPAQIEKLH